MSANKLADTLLVLLSAAAQHPEGAIELASDLNGAAQKNWTRAANRASVSRSRVGP